MKHAKFSYHRWNMIRRFLNRPLGVNFGFGFIVLARAYFDYKEYIKENEIK